MLASKHSRPVSSNHESQFHILKPCKAWLIWQLPDLFPGDLIQICTLAPLEHFFSSSRKIARHLCWVNYVFAACLTRSAKECKHRRCSWIPYFSLKWALSVWYDSRSCLNLTSATCLFPWFWSGWYSRALVRKAALISVSVYGWGRLASRPSTEKWWATLARFNKS